MCIFWKENVRVSIISAGTVCTIGEVVLSGSEVAVNGGEVAVCCGEVGMTERWYITWLSYDYLLLR